MTAMTWFQLVIVSILIVSPTFSLNILFLFGGGNVSHKLSVWPLVVELAERGYNVTFVSSNAKQPIKNTKVHDITPKALSAGTDSLYSVDRFQDRKSREEYKVWSTYDESSLKICHNILNSKDEPVLSNLIDNGKFDLIVINAVYGECGFLLAHHYGSKYVVFDSSHIIPWFHGIYGIPIEASWIPSLLTSQNEYPMGILDRMKAVYYYFLVYERKSSFKNQMMEMYKRRFNLQSAPDFTDIERNTSLVLVNIHYTIDFARSLPPMFVPIAGMQCWEPPGKLPQVIFNQIK